MLNRICRLSVKKDRLRNDNDTNIRDFWIHHINDKGDYWENYHLQKSIILSGYFEGLKIDTDTRFIIEPGSTSERYINRLGYPIIPLTERFPQQSSKIARYNEAAASLRGLILKDNIFNTTPEDLSLLMIAENNPRLIIYDKCSELLKF